MAGGMGGSSLELHESWVFLLWKHRIKDKGLEDPEAPELNHDWMSDRICRLGGNYPPDTILPPS